MAIALGTTIICIDAGDQKEEEKTEIVLDRRRTRPRLVAERENETGAI
jgi:hypothetical protein